MLFLVVAAAFGTIYGYRYSGVFTIYWPEGVGGAALPAALAIFWASIRKLSSREIYFLSSWIVAFCLFSFALVGVNLYVALQSVH